MTVAKNNAMSPFTKLMDPETLDTIIIQLFIIHHSLFNQFSFELKD